MTQNKGGQGTADACRPASDAWLDRAQVAPVEHALQEPVGSGGTGIDRDEDRGERPFRAPESVA